MMKEFGDFGNGSMASWTKGAPNKVWTSCADTHKPLILRDGLVVHGGAAAHPNQKDADIYISFDSGTSYDPKGYPWNPGEFVFFPITDMSVPKDPEEFKKMVKWTALQIEAGKKVHGGCIGGHGRTGLWLAALVKEMTGEVDAITYVRKNYCEKAVESATQVDFLHKHFGIKKVSGAKSGFMGTGAYSTEWAGSTTGKQKNGLSRFQEKYGGKQLQEQAFEAKPIYTKGNVWGV